MVLMVSPPNLSNDSPSPSPREQNLVVLVCLSNSPNSTAKNSVIIINNYNDRTTKCVSGCNFSPEGNRSVLNADLNRWCEGPNDHISVIHENDKHGRREKNNDVIERESYMYIT